ncbi:hypothetical protein CL634_06285 [bacterium]|nr:hypothetical protein [bacterium]
MKLMTKSLLRKMILEQVDELFSASEEEDNTRLSRDSIDDQIDSFILKFERDSIDKDSELSGDSLSESFNNLSLSGLLQEQEEEEEDVEIVDEPEAGGDDAGDTADDEVFSAEPPDDPSPEGSEDTDAEAPEALPKPPLDVDSFTKRIARLAMNADSLLDLKSAIVNRAMNFLVDNYDQQHADEMKEILDSQFDFNLDGGKEVPLAPEAVGAWAGGTGGLGGGGGA